MDLVVVSHHPPPTPFERTAELVEGLLDRRTIGVSRLLQLPQLEGPVGAEQDRLEGGRDLTHRRVASVASTWIAPNRSFWRTTTRDLRSSSRTATNVTTASRRSSDSRISSTSSIGPLRRRSVMRSSFSWSVHVRPVTTRARGGMRASTLLNATIRSPTSSGSSWPPASTGRGGGGEENEAFPPPARHMGRGHGRPPGT